MNRGAKDIQGLAARRAALRLLDAVLRRGETLDQARAATAGLLTSSDAALARAIAGEALRWLADLDALIDSATRQNLADDAKARTVLRLMLAQWLRLDTPPHAVVERWGERAVAIAPGLAAPPPLDLNLRDPAAKAEWAAKLGGASHMHGQVRLPRGTAVTELPGFADGAWWVQDLAASLPARLLGADPGRVLDLCAAPGGKTLQLAAGGWAVTALDVSGKRLKLLRENLARTGLAAEVVVADALQWEPPEPFDAIVLDAPCTATGTARRHPDVLHRIGPRQIDEMAELQAQLLERACRWLEPDGTLIYAVCSLEREEGEEQAARVPLTLDPIRPDELPDWLSPTPEGWLRTDPGMLAEHGGMDGFFIARFVNKA